MHSVIANFSVQFWVDFEHTQAGMKYREHALS